MKGEICVGALVMLKQFRVSRETSDYTNLTDAIELFSLIVLVYPLD